jgi:uncharacterized protein
VNLIRAMRWFFGLIAVVLLVFFVRLPNGVPKSVVLSDLAGQWRGAFAITYNVPIKTRDQVVLMNDLYLPNRGTEAVGTVLIRLPYGKSLYSEARRAARFFASAGFAVLVQDIRGRFASGGQFVPYSHAVEDGFDTVQWITEQSWSNARVGSFGCSALGEIQLITAKAPHPALKAMIVRGSGGAMGSARGRFSYFGLYEGGIFNLAAGAGWFSIFDPSVKRSDAKNLKVNSATLTSMATLPSIAILGGSLAAPKNYERFLSTALDSKSWDDLGFLHDQTQLSIPTLAFNTWYDPTVADTFVMAAMAKDSAKGQPSHHHVIVGPGNHCSGDSLGEDDVVGDLKIDYKNKISDTKSPDNGLNFPYWQTYLNWFSYWLAKTPTTPNPSLSMSAFQVFEIGKGEWAGSDQWPPQNAVQRRWALSSQKGANSKSGDGVLNAQTQGLTVGAFDEFKYDPLDPVPTRGGPVCCVQDPAIRAGAVDQTDVDNRADVLVYTSAPLQQALRMVGNSRAHLTVSSTAKDTDLIARLVDVAPDGKTFNIQEGALRLRYRDGGSKPALMLSGQRYLVDIDIRPAAYVLAAGHRLRLQITSSSFPRLERNLNTGGRNYDEIKPVIAINRIWHEKPEDSYLEFYEQP